ncbi:hypothetical protein ECANGB1_1914 [Enterospora canceri]|uniref:Uncharacterized protein n=1 Tax=Enterospora canceri TaxID=1081671 RepID=A0A1Y1SA55_9MICR|nr:hypothetical protein ECANGB1_1914 [Enterospora canceri]
MWILKKISGIGLLIGSVRADDFDYEEEERKQSIVDETMIKEVHVTSYTVAVEFATPKMIRSVALRSKEAEKVVASFDESTYVYGMDGENKDCLLEDVTKSTRFLVLSSFLELRTNLYKRTLNPNHTVVTAVIKNFIALKPWFKDRLLPTSTVYDCVKLVCRQYAFVSLQELLGVLTKDAGTQKGVDSRYWFEMKAYDPRYNILVETKSNYFMVIRNKKEADQPITGIEMLKESPFAAADTKSEKFRSWWRRHKFAIAFGVVLPLFLVIVIVTVLIKYRREKAKHYTILDL